MSLAVSADVDLAPLTTLELGGPARHFAVVESEDDLREAFHWAAHEGVEVVILGGGSNVLVADEGIEGLTLKVAPRGVEVSRQGDEVRLRVAAGEPWDPLVARSVSEGWAGLECLSGIPGLVGATPIQNVGAYGQDVSQVVRSVTVHERATARVREMSASECCFAYRDSVFKREPGRAVVLAVELVLRAGGAPSLAYAELERALHGRSRPTLAEVRQTVIALRRRKSMVLDPDDPNHRSAGSFFTNPIMPDADADDVVARAVGLGVVTGPNEVPRYAAGPGRSKLAAGWLIERAGFARGTRRGAVGISSSHALALVHHGGGSSRELLALAREVRDGVQERFGVRLTLEPRLLGFRGAVL